ncbi:hypothetical protein SAMN04487960_10548 [Marinobacter mobilis]|uniref:Uncharacterized protein n=1 Tax=Marinobacter mobilis TaxID=488533 RepID=A0A1H2XH68_9GAMM|nr:hypothetical protein SAMN04487960_10548 [Marinobacter mobilis]
MRGQGGSAQSVSGYSPHTNLVFHRNDLQQAGELAGPWAGFFMRAENPAASTLDHACNGHDAVLAGHQFIELPFNFGPVQPEVIINAIRNRLSAP